MAVIEEIKIFFSGSFQCRLATDPAPTASSPKGPKNVPAGAAGAGWTFSYQEPAFDRVIRLSKPVSLRNALMEPFRPVKVEQIQIKPRSPIATLQLPWQTVSTDPLLGTEVSLGSSAVFDTAAGTGALTQEAILNLKFSIGSLFSAEPKSRVLLDGMQGSDTAWSADYLARKPGLVLANAANMDVSRFNLLTTSPSLVGNYSIFYSYRCPTRQISLVNVEYPLNVTGILRTLLLGWHFYLDLAFYRFDGDTLVGQMDGTLRGVHSDL